MGKGQVGNVTFVTHISQKNYKNFSLKNHNFLKACNNTTRA